MASYRFGNLRFADQHHIVERDAGPYGEVEWHLPEFCVEGRVLDARHSLDADGIQRAGLKQPRQGITLPGRQREGGAAITMALGLYPRRSILGEVRNELLTLDHPATLMSPTLRAGSRARWPHRQRPTH